LNTRAKRQAQLSEKNQGLVLVFKRANNLNEDEDTEDISYVI
jgi:hypothetical protein